MGTKSRRRGGAKKDIDYKACRQTMGSHGYTTSIEGPARNLQASAGGQDLVWANSAKRDGQGYVILIMFWHYSVALFV
jgi:hypothetical protein